MPVGCGCTVACIDSQRLRCRAVTGEHAVAEIGDSADSRECRVAREDCRISRKADGESAASVGHVDVGCIPTSVIANSDRAGIRVNEKLSEPCCRSNLAGDVDVAVDIGAGRVDRQIEGIVDGALQRKLHAASSAIGVCGIYRRVAGQVDVADSGEID